MPFLADRRTDPVRRIVPRDPAMPPSPSRMTDPEREALCCAVARTVMGWFSTEIPWAYDGVTPLWHTADGDPHMTVVSWRPDCNDTQNMQVLDRMIELGFELELSVCGNRTIAEFTLESVPVARGEDWNRRIALMRAALDAVEAQPDASEFGRDSAC